MSSIEDLIQDAVDIHVHFAPDPRVERRANGIETAQCARDLGMRALVFKSHEYPTVPVAYTVGKLVPELQILGGVSLDYEVGGMNPRAVEASAKMGARMVWMPTFSAAADRRRRGLEGGISILDERGDLTPDTREVLDVVKAHDLVLATGHLSVKESMVLVKQARKTGIKRVVVTHGSIMNRWVGMTVEDMQNLAALGAFIEHCTIVMMPGMLDMPVQELVGMIKTVGAERCILSTDMGQWYNPIAPEGFRMSLATLLQGGLSQEELGVMAKHNPAELLGLE